MGIANNISHDQWPKQGRHIGQRVAVCFRYDLSHQTGGTIVRDDIEEPGVGIIRLDDGRFVLFTECMYSIGEVRLR